jgi:hypothetical protein
MHDEFLGYFGLSWQEKLASDLYNLYNDKNLKIGFPASITHGSNWNVDYINQIESAYKQGKNSGYSGDALASFMRNLVQFANPDMAKSYVALRETAGGGMIENIVSSVVKPISSAAGQVVGSVSAPLTKPLAIVAIIAVVGLIGYTQLAKVKKGVKKSAV